VILFRAGIGRREDPRGYQNGHPLCHWLKLTVWPSITTLGPSGNQLRAAPEAYMAMVVLTRLHLLAPVPLFWSKPHIVSISILPSRLCTFRITDLRCKLSIYRRN